MSKKNTTRVWFSVIGTFVLLAAILGGGYMAYRTGYAQGTIAEQAGEVDSFTSPVPHYGYRFHYPHFGFGSFFFTFIFFMMIFGMIRRLFFFPRWGWYGRPHHHKGWKRHHMGPWFDDDEDSNDEKPEKDTESS